jgi:hypothetical protein
MWTGGTSCTAMNEFIPCISRCQEHMNKIQFHQFSSSLLLPLFSVVILTACSHLFGVGREEQGKSNRVGEGDDAERRTMVCQGMLHPLLGRFQPKGSPQDPSPWCLSFSYDIQSLFIAGLLFLLHQHSLNSLGDIGYSRPGSHCCRAFPGPYL